MDSFKIATFQRKRPNDRFPWFREFAPDEAARIHRQLCGMTGLAGDADGLSLVWRMEEAGTVIASQDFEVSSLNIAGLLHRHGLNPDPRIFINWYRFDEVDEMRLEDVSKHFADIWYPGAEDPDIFDSSLTWMLSISHYSSFVLRGLGRLSGATMKA